MGKIFVSNLSPSATEVNIRNLFTQWGKVLSVELVTDRRTGKCRGYGFVEMEDGKDSEAAHALDGINFEGQSLLVASLTGC